MNKILVGIIIFITIILFLYLFSIFYYDKMIESIKFNTLKIHSIALNSNNKNIDIPLLYINLNRSPDRNQYILDQLDTLNITNYKRVDGIDGKKLKSIKEGEVDGISYKNDYNLSLSELGCLLSHIKSISIAYNSNLSYAFIIEDDCYLELSVLWKYKLSTIINQLNEINKDWGIIKFQFPYKKPSNKLEYRQYTSKDKWMNATGYIINEKGMKDILEKTNFPNLILGGKNQPTHGQADSFLFDLTNTFITNQPYMIPNNLKLESLLHPSHSFWHLYNTYIYLDAFVN
jgi:GR25 family glycosyltransferase involved in LPS biosynthesis